MKIYSFSLKAILLFLLTTSVLKPSAEGQKIILLYQEISLSKVNSSQKGHLDLNLPNPSIPSFQIIQIYYSTPPSEQLVEEGILKGRWRVDKLRGHKRIEVLTVLHLEEDLNMKSNLQYAKADFDNIHSSLESNWTQCTISSTGNLQFESTPKSKEVTPDSSELNIHQYGNESLIEEHFSGKNKNQVKKTNHYISTNTEVIQGIALTLYELPNHHPFVDNIFRYLTLIQPNNYSNYNFLGVSLARKGEFFRAKLQLQKSLSLAKEGYPKAHALYGLANYHALKNEKEKALEYLELAKNAEENFEILSTIEDRDFINLKDYPPFLKLMKKDR